MDPSAVFTGLHTALSSTIIILTEADPGTSKRCHHLPGVVVGRVALHQVQEGTAAEPAPAIQGTIATCQPYTSTTYVHTRYLGGGAGLRRLITVKIKDI